MASLEDRIRADVQAVETGVKTEFKPYFDKARVDIRELQPELIKYLGVDTSDEHGVLHATLDLLFELIAAYGPPEIRVILGGVQVVDKAIEAEKAAQ